MKSFNILVISALAKVFILSGCIEQSLIGSPEQDNLASRSYFTTQEDCHLPCWAGIIPGESTQDEVVAALQNRYGINNVATENGWSFQWESSSNPVDISGRGYATFANEDDIAVSFVYVIVKESITVLDLVTELGEPSSVRVVYDANAGCWHTSLIYPDIRTLVTVGGPLVDEDQLIVALELLSEERITAELSPGSHAYDVEWDGYRNYCWTTEANYTLQN